MVVFPSTQRIMILMVSVWFVSGCTATPTTPDRGVVPSSFSIADRIIQKPVVSWKQLREPRHMMQQYDYSCGAGSLVTLLHYLYQDPVEEADVVADVMSHLSEDDVNNRRHNGFTLLDLKQYAERRGYKAVGVRLELQALAKLTLPVLVHVYVDTYSHFAVFQGIREDRVFLADPSRGKIRMPIQQFQKEWSTHAALILLRPGQTIPPIHSLQITEGRPLRHELINARQWLK